MRSLTIKNMIMIEKCMVGKDNEKNEGAATGIGYYRHKNNETVAGIKSASCRTCGRVSQWWTSGRDRVSVKLRGQW